MISPVPIAAPVCFDLAGFSLSSLTVDYRERNVTYNYFSQEKSLKYQKAFPHRSLGLMGNGS